MPLLPNTRPLIQHILVLEKGVMFTQARENWKHKGKINLKWRQSYIRHSKLPETKENTFRAT